MKFLSIILLMGLPILSISCIEEDEYVSKEDKIETKQLENVLMNRTNDSSIYSHDTIRIYESSEPCVGWDCNKFGKKK